MGLFSYYPFAIALPSERTEAILHGMVAALEFFGCVPREVWWNNAKTVAAAILQRRERTLHPRYQALSSHFNFEPLFCLSLRGNEKPYVETRVKCLQRRGATPVEARLSHLAARVNDRDTCGYDELVSLSERCFELSVGGWVPQRNHRSRPFRNRRCLRQSATASTQY